MVYIFALVGFFMGFGVGLGTINVILRNVNVHDVQADKGKRTFYGLLVWVFALVGLILGILIHNNFY